MPTQAARLINSRFGLGLAAAAGRLAPPLIGFRIARAAASLIAPHRDWDVVEGARLNQWVASGGKLNSDSLDTAVRCTFQNIARSVFELYRYIDSPADLLRLIDLEGADELLAPLFSARGGRGLVLVAIHACGSDLVTQALSRRGYKAMWLTLPELRGGYRAHFEMRRRSGMEVYPTSTATMRQAVRYLQRGGVVATGIDRPMPSPRRHPSFFGRPSCLPTFYVRLALQAQVPVAILAPLMNADGRYHVRIGASIEMLPDPDPEAEILRNTEQVLHIVEDLIGTDPTQWAMTLPVWPEALGEVP